MNQDPASKMVELRFVFQGIQERKAAEDAAAAAAKQAQPKTHTKGAYRL